MHVVTRVDRRTARFAWRDRRTRPSPRVRPRRPPSCELGRLVHGERSAERLEEGLDVSRVEKAVAVLVEGCERLAHLRLGEVALAALDEDAPRPRPRPSSRVARPNASAPPRRRRRGGRRRPSGVAGRRARRRRPRCPPRLTQTRRSPRSRRPCTGTPTERCRGRRRTRTRGAPRPTSCWRGVAGEARCPARPHRRNRRTRRGTSTRGVFARVVRSTRGARLAPPTVGAARASVAR